MFSIHLWIWTLKALPAGVHYRTSTSISDAECDFFCNSLNGTDNCCRIRIVCCVLVLLNEYYDSDLINTSLASFPAFLEHK